MNQSQIKALRTFCKDQVEKKITIFKADELAAKKLALAKLAKLGDECGVTYNATEAFIDANGKLVITLEVPKEHKEVISKLLPDAYPHYNSANNLRKYLEEKVNGTLLELSLMGDVAAGNIMHKVNAIFR